MSPGAGGDSPNKKSPAKRQSIVSNNAAVAMLEDTGDELQHMQTSHGMPRGADISNLGGAGMDDDDSDGVEYLREQMLIQAQRMV